MGTATRRPVRCGEAGAAEPIRFRGAARDRTANRHVSQRLRELRGDRGLSQREAADLLSRTTGTRWTVQSLSRAELCRGTYIRRWSVDDLYALCAAFDVPLSYFLPEAG